MDKASECEQVVLQSGGILHCHVRVPECIAQSYIYNIHIIYNIYIIIIYIYVTYGGFLKPGYPKSSILGGISIINHPFWGTTI